MIWENKERQADGVYVAGFEIDIFGLSADDLHHLRAIADEVGVGISVLSVHISLFEPVVPSLQYGIWLTL